MNGFTGLCIAVVVVLMMAGCAPKPHFYSSAIVEYDLAPRPSKDGDDK